MELEGLGLEVIHVDLWVINKPGGLLAVPGRGEDKQDCVASRIQAIDPAAKIVHRLDQPTSGVMLMARNAQVQRSLDRQFANRQVDKLYLARVAGILPACTDWNLIDLPIWLDWPLRPKYQIDFFHPATAEKISFKAVLPAELTTPG
jgi:tRNA pseudouridine32 synthase/23S rRNA pseudouridine746 synthase